MVRSLKEIYFRTSTISYCLTYTAAFVINITNNIIIRILIIIEYWVIISLLIIKFMSYIQKVLLLMSHGIYIKKKYIKTYRIIQTIAICETILHNNLLWNFKVFNNIFFSRWSECIFSLQIKVNLTSTKLFSSFIVQKTTIILKLVADAWGIN